MENLFNITTLGGFALRLLIASVLGAIIGLERQWTKHQAGIMTNVIVCVGSFAFTSFSYLISNPDVDVTRIAAQVVSGIGFLGAGLIIRDGGNVKGLNTAATVWASASVGVLCCIEKFYYAIIVAFTIVVLHLVIHPFSEKLNNVKKYEKVKNEKKEKYYKISVTCPEDDALSVRTNIMTIIKNEPSALLHNLESSEMENENIKIRAYISTKTDNDNLIESLLTKVGTSKQILSAGWKVDEQD